jgi:hypothetical protein
LLRDQEGDAHDRISDAWLHLELARLGSPSDRLQPVYDLAQKGCAQYDESAACFATAAEIGAPVAGTSEERKFQDAIDCGFAAPGKGSKLLADAEIKGFEIKEGAGEPVRS